jgi:hypothetical protein
MSYDIALWDIQDGEVVRECPKDGGLITGIQKVAQRVLIALLEEQGAPRYSIGRPVKPGCHFMTSLKSGSILSETGVFAHGGLACGVVKQELATDTRDDDPPEERLKAVQFEQLHIAQDVMYLWLVVTSHTDSITMILPISTRDIP